ncbi:MAG: hypothetical protein DSY47_02880, partial [Hydrogenothermus sp.]
VFEELALENAKSIATRTFNSMFQIMKKGWSREDLIEFLDSLKDSQKNYEINIYRTKIVESLFGQINQPPFDEKILKSITEGSELIFKDKGKIRFIMPIKAEKVCLKCHTNAKIGDILGVIEVRSDLSKIISFAKNEFSKALIFAFPLPLIFIVLIGYFITKKIKQEVNKLHELTESVSKLEDLEKINKSNIEFPFEEFDEIYTNIKELVNKMSRIAVDKKVLEFEIMLLEKFILTSDIVKDWKQHILLLLQEINKILPTLTIFSVSKELDKYEVEFFWIGMPSQSIKTKFERIVNNKIKDFFNSNKLEHININHNIAKKDICILDISSDDIEYKTKYLVLEKPKIGVIVGIGFSSEIMKSKTQLLVIESILSTLLNIVGSVKAIYKYTKELEYYATRDPLTNLYNQRIFKELLDYEAKRAQRHNYKFSLLVIDLDNFKVINDTYGHDFGDRFLVEVSNILRSSVRPGDIVARYGGDEFVIVLPETDEKGAHLVAKRILKNVENHFIKTPDGKIINPKISIGVSTYPEHTDNVEDLFSLADTMMYKAKSAGKGQIKLPTNKDIEEFFNKEKHISIILSEAINKKEIIPYFQPILNIKTGKIEAYEVLSRIEYNGEIIPASNFIEIAEKTGMIFNMDLILLENVFKKIKDRNEKFFFNLSPKALVFSDYLNKVNNLVKEYNINPENIVFEITERDTVRNLSILQKFVLELKESGFKFAIDDFGSGFSSFYYVKEFAIDFIKIEGEFIKNLINDKKDKAFVESIVTLSKRLDIKTVAEFIENKSVFEAVKELDVDYAQGYYIGKPSPDFSYNN